MAEAPTPLARASCANACFQASNPPGPLPQTSGEIGVAARNAGYRSAVGIPIIVEGRLWGVITARSSEGLLPPGTESRLSSFTEFVATAVANAEARDALTLLAKTPSLTVEADLTDWAEQQYPVTLPDDEYPHTQATIASCET